MTRRSARGTSPERERAAQEGQSRHVPVLLAAVLEALAPAPGDRIIDGTFGAGGYTRAILEASGCCVLALDRDPTAIAAEPAVALAREQGDRLALKLATFSTLDEVASVHGWGQADGVVLDIGVSSMQLDTPERGFSFQHEGPLDMRMGASGESAADVVNSLDAEPLAAILFELGEERRSRAIARAIIKAREAAPITTTAQLADIVAGVLGRKPGDPKHPATRTFQALRAHVNDELGELRAGLAAAERILAPGGRLVVVSFHSLEDRIAKRFLARRCGEQDRGSRHLPQLASARAQARDPSFQFLNRRPVSPNETETAANPRARSAKLRAAVRTAAAPWPTDDD
ncbi:MAG: 16S rRNA (cytosine(1402)-N(4))-methyltransferase RsmH [Pseudomonadota bacterium]